MVTGYFNFDPRDPIYLDHFPGSPVVPGSLIIHAFIKALGEIDEGKSKRQVTNFRFKRFISPGRYVYCIEPKPDGRMACSLLDNGQTVVTGVL